MSSQSVSGSFSKISGTQVSGNQQGVEDLSRLLKIKDEINSDIDSKIKVVVGDLILEIQEKDKEILKLKGQVSNLTGLVKDAQYLYKEVEKEKSGLVKINSFLKESMKNQNSDSCNNISKTSENKNSSEILEQKNSDLTKENESLRIQLKALQDKISNTVNTTVFLGTAPDKFFVGDGSNVYQLPKKNDKEILFTSENDKKQEIKNENDKFTVIVSQNNVKKKEEVSFSISKTGEIPLERKANCNNVAKEICTYFMKKYHESMIVLKKSAVIPLTNIELFKFLYDTSIADWKHSKEIKSDKADNETYEAFDSVYKEFTNVINVPNTPKVSIGYAIDYVDENATKDKDSVEVIYKKDVEETKRLSKSFQVNLSKYLVKCQPEEGAQLLSSIDDNMCFLIHKTDKELSNDDWKKLYEKARKYDKKKHVLLIIFSSTKDKSDHKPSWDFIASSEVYRPKHEDIYTINFSTENGSPTINYEFIEEKLDLILNKLRCDRSKKSPIKPLESETKTTVVLEKKELSKSMIEVSPDDSKQCFGIMHDVGQLFSDRLDKSLKLMESQKYKSYCSPVLLHKINQRISDDLEFSKKLYAEFEQCLTTEDKKNLESKLSPYWKKAGAPRDVKVKIRYATFIYEQEKLLKNLALKVPQEMEEVLKQIDPTNTFEFEKVAFQDRKDDDITLCFYRCINRGIGDWEKEFYPNFVDIKGRKIGIVLPDNTTDYPTLVPAYHVAELHESNIARDDILTLEYSNLGGNLCETELNQDRLKLIIEKLRLQSLPKYKK